MTESGQHSHGPEGTRRSREDRPVQGRGRNLPHRLQKGSIVYELGSKARAYDKDAWGEILEKCRIARERLKKDAASLRRNSLAIAAGSERLRLRAQRLREEHYGTSHSANVVCFEVPKLAEQVDRAVVPGENWGKVIAFPDRAG